MRTWGKISKIQILVPFGDKKTSRQKYVFVISKGAENRANIDSLKPEYTRGVFFTKTQLWLILSSVRLFLGQYPAQDKLISFPGCRIAQVFVECKGPGDRNPSLFHPETWEKWSSPGFLLLQCSPKFPSYFFFLSMFYFSHNVVGKFLFF